MMHLPAGARRRLSPFRRAEATAECRHLAVGLYRADGNRFDRQAPGAALKLRDMANGLLTSAK
jgi:hypothetical protein